MEKSSRDRVEFSTTASSLSLGIGPKRRAGRWSLLFAPFAFAFWVYGLYGTVGEVVRPDENTVLLFTYLALSGLIVGGMVSFPAFSWSAFGKEVVEVYAGRFTVAKELGGFRYRSKSFNTLDVECLRTGDSPGFLHSLAQLFRGRPTSGNIAFEAEGRMYRFGSYLEEDDAREAAERVKEYLPNMRGRL